MFEPAKTCPQLSVISRWGFAKCDEDSLRKQARAAAKRLLRGYLFFPADHTTMVKNPGSRLAVQERIICVYKDEIDIVREATEKFNLTGFEFKHRERTTFGEEFEFMERKLVENPGFIVIADNGLNQFCWMDDVPGQPDPTPQAVTAKIAFALRCAAVHHTKLMCVRHQKSDGPSVLVRGLPPSPKSASTGYVNFDPPPGMGDMQQLFFLSAAAKGHWRPWSYCEDRARALDERRISGQNSVALYEGLTVRFGEKELMEVRFSSPEHARNTKILKAEYPFLKFKSRGAKHHG